MRSLLSVIVAVVSSLIVVVGWKPILGIEQYYADIEITALGAKDPASMGSEVWVHGQNWPDGVTIENFLKEAAPPEGWEMRGFAAMSYQNQPATIGWRGWVGPEATLIFTRHDWSGEMRLTINGTTRSYDLFHAGGAGPELIIPLKQVPAVFRTSLTSLPRTLLPAALLAILSLLIYSALRAGREPIMR